MVPPGDGPSPKVARRCPCQDGRTCRTSPAHTTSPSRSPTSTGARRGTRSSSGCSSCSHPTKRVCGSGSWPTPPPSGSWASESTRTSRAGPSTSDGPASTTSPSPSPAGESSRRGSRSSSGGASRTHPSGRPRSGRSSPSGTRTTSSSSSGCRSTPERSAERRRHALELARDVRTRRLVGELGQTGGGQAVEPLAQLGRGTGEREGGEERRPLHHRRPVPVVHEDEVAVVDGQVPALGGHLLHRLPPRAPAGEGVHGVGPAPLVDGVVGDGQRGPGGGQHPVIGRCLALGEDRAEGQQRPPGWATFGRDGD